jgi:O-antigen ligase
VIAVRRPVDARQVPVAVVVGVVAVAAGSLAGRAPTLAAAVAIGAAAAVYASTRLLLAVGAMVVSFVFEDYLATLGSVGVLTPTKVIGLLAVAAWVVEWAVRGRPVRTAPALWAVLGIAVWVLPAAAAARDLERAVLVGSRYVMFAALFFLLLQAVAGDRRRAGLLLDAAVLSAALAAAVGLLQFFGGAVDRARGPLDNPNDFGFVLASTIPLAVVRFRAGGRGRMVVVGLAAAVTFAGVLGTYSRSALAGLAVAAVFAVVTRRLPLRVAALVVAGLAVAGFLAYRANPDVVDQALARKEAVADQNVQTRLGYWQVALDEWGSSPALGVGPGNYETRFAEFGSRYLGDEVQPATHNAYLNVLAELGLPGLGLFLVFLGLSWRTLRRRPADDGSTAVLRAALAASFVVALVGSMFLNEQFYAPLWFASALGAGLGDP